jgi:hypothetical protein
MDCKEFLDRHSLYVDVRCSALEENEMREHLRACATCSRHDTLVRRSLLLVHNLPRVEVSPDFRARLDARLRMVKPFSAAAPAPRVALPSIGVLLAAAASIVLLVFAAHGYIARRDDAITLAPVVASLPESDPSSIASSAFVATVPTGMSVWPAIMVASQAPAHFVSAELAGEH